MSKNGIQDKKKSVGGWRRQFKREKKKVTKLPGSEPYFRQIWTGTAKNLMGEAEIPL